MDQAVRKRMTLDEFLAWERRQELRYEFDGFEPIAMTGGTVEHSVIASNLVEALNRRLGDGPCRAFRGDVKVVVAESVRYPDLIVTCSPVPRRTDIIPEPVVVVEVLSASTARADRTIKNTEYRATASIQHYVMLEQLAAAATVFTRTGDDWIGRLVTGIDAQLELPAIGLRIPFAEIYARIELAADEADD